MKITYNFVHTDLASSSSAYKSSVAISRGVEDSHIVDVDFSKVETVTTTWINIFLYGLYNKVGEDFLCKVNIINTNRFVSGEINKVLLNMLDQGL